MLLALVAQGWDAAVPAHPFVGTPTPAFHRVVFGRALLDETDEAVSGTALVASVRPLLERLGGKVVPVLGNGRPRLLVVACAGALHV